MTLGSLKFINGGQTTAYTQETIAPKCSDVLCPGVKMAICPAHRLGFSQNQRDQGAASVTENQIPATKSKSIEFVSLLDILFSVFDVVAPLATAIETHGIYAWDRFGRMKKCIPDSPEAQTALNLVESIYVSRDGPPENEISYLDFLDSGAGRYGWPGDEVPDFDSIRSGLYVRSTPSTLNRPSVKGENANAGMVLALLKFIKGELDNDSHPEYQSEAQLAAFLESKMIGYPGVSVDNFKKKFADAKKLIPKTEL